MNYPLPSYAASVWLAGAVLRVELGGHTIALPASQAGLSALLSILRDRQRNTQSRLCEPGAPTGIDAQALAVALARGDTTKGRTDAERREAQTFLTELGL